MPDTNDRERSDALITVTITIEELKNGMMCLYAENDTVGEVKPKEAMTWKVLEEKLSALIKNMSDGSSRSVCAEGESATKVREMMRNQEGSDGDGR